MECEDTPEIGDNSGAAWYEWDDSKLYNKKITVVCPLGKVFIFLSTTSFHESHHENCRTSF